MVFSIRGGQKKNHDIVATPNASTNIASGFYHLMKLKWSLSCENCKIHFPHLRIINFNGKRKISWKRIENERVLVFLHWQDGFQWQFVNTTRTTLVFFSNFILIQLNSLEQILSCRDGKCKLKSDKVSDEESNTDVDVANGDLIIHHVDVEVVQVVPDGGVVATWSLM